MGIILIILFWEIGAIYVKNHFKFSNEILPSIEYVLTTSFPDLATFGAGGMGGFSEPSYFGALIVLSKHSIFTLARVLGGTLIGLFIGMGIALLMWWNRNIKSLLEPLILIFKNIPLLALMPLFLFWFGGREVGNIVYIVFAISVMIVINTTNAIGNLPPIYQLFALTMGASRNQILRTIIIPGIIPEVIGGIRVILATSWAITLGAEFLAAQSGIGKILIFSMNFVATGRMIVILLLFIIYANLIYTFFGKLTNYFTRWMPK